MGIAHDFAEEARRGEGLSVSEGVFKAFFLRSPDAILIVDAASGEILDANPATDRILGYGNEALRGKRFSVLLPPERKQSAMDLLEKLTHHGAVPDIQRFQRADGLICPVELTGTVIPLKEGKAVFTTLRDLSERVGAEEEIRRRNRELALLNQAGRAFSSSLNPDRVLATVLEEVRHLMDAVASSLWLMDTRTEELVCRQATGPRREVVQGWRLQPGQGLVGWVMQSGQSKRVPDLQSEAHHFKGVDAETGLISRSALCVPLEIKQRVIGALQVVDSEIDRFTTEDVAVLESLAASAAIAIENAQLFEQTQQEISERLQAEEATHRRNRELEMLNHVITTAASTLDAEQMLQIACKELAHALHLPQAAATLLNAEATEAEVVAEYLAPGRPSGLGATVPVTGNPATEYVLEHHQPLSVTDALTDERLAAIRTLMRERGTTSLLIVPIPVARGRVAGTIEVEATERREFSPGEIALAQSVATAAGQALEMARLYQAVRRQAERLQETVTQRTIELQDALARARDADRLKSEFVSNVSHELRNPLTNLKLYLALLARGQSEKRDSYLNVLYRETDRLQDLIEGLLDLSRLDLGKIQANLLATDLNVVVSTLTRDRTALVADRGLIVDVEPAEGLPQALADPQLLEQVLTNLLTNAVNYTPAGGRITLSTGTARAESRDWVTVSVSDTGPGISKADRAHLFERFYRGEAGRESGAPGTGLGLAICKEIMDLHNGRISVQSEIGQGSTFTIWLTIAEQ